jgi:hypothetical protein
MKTEISVFVISMLIVLMMSTPTPSVAVTGPVTDHLQYKFYNGQSVLFTALLIGDIDIMAWPLSYSQYQIAINTNNITVAPNLTFNSYMAYRTGMVGIINDRNYGWTANLDFTYLNSKTPPYGHPMTIRIGTMQPPEQLNPIFSQWDYTVIDSMFTSYMTFNPYKPRVPGKSPAGRDLPWMAYDWKIETMDDGNANVTLWFRNDITWHDGVPFTVDDFRYTIWLNQQYDDSWGYSDMQHVVGFQKWDDWACSVQFDFPSHDALYTCLYDIVPKHIYQYIIPPSPNDYTTGHHGEWPGKNALPSQIIPNPYFTWSQLTGPDGGKYVWVGTNMWQYHPDTYVSGVGGGMTLDAYPGFWMNITQGEIAFNYRWNPGPPPQSGSYTIGLADLVLLANAYGTSGNGHPVPFMLGGAGVWEPGADIAAPAGTVGLSDLVTLALNYGKIWGNNTAVSPPSPARPGPTSQPPNFVGIWSKVTFTSMSVRWDEGKGYYNCSLQQNLALVFRSDKKGYYRRIVQNGYDISNDTDGKIFVRRWWVIETPGVDIPNFTKVYPDGEGWILLGKPSVIAPQSLVLSTKITHFNIEFTWIDSKTRPDGESVIKNGADHGEPWPRDIVEMYINDTQQKNVDPVNVLADEGRHSGPELVLVGLGGGAYADFLEPTAGKVENSKQLFSDAPNQWIDYPFDRILNFQNTNTAEKAFGIGWDMRTPLEPYPEKFGYSKTSLDSGISFP